MDTTQVWPWLVDTFGGFAAVVGGVALLVKYLLPKYEQSRQELIDAYKAQLEEDDQSRQELIDAYKAQLEEAKKAIQEANEERKQVTDKYLNAMSTFVTHTNEILSQLVKEVRELKETRPSRCGEIGSDSKPAEE